MLIGNEKIKNINNDDICNYIGNSLCGLGVKSVSIEKMPWSFPKHERLLVIKYNDGWVQITILDTLEWANKSIKEVLEDIINSRKNLKSGGKFGKL